MATRKLMYEARALARRVESLQAPHSVAGLVIHKSVIKGTVAISIVLNCRIISSPSVAYISDL